MALETVWDAFSLGVGVLSFGYNISEGSYGLAALDAAGIIVDAITLAVPFLPGGVGVALQASRQSGRIAQVRQVHAAVNVAQGGYEGVRAAGNEQYGWAAFYGGMTLLGGRGIANEAARIKTDRAIRLVDDLPAPRSLDAFEASFIGSRIPCTCFVRGTLVATSSALDGTTTPIDVIAVGDRVATRSGDTRTDVDSTWRVAELEMRLPGAGSLRIELLRSPDWFATTRAEIGRELWIDLPEIGIAGTMSVVGIREVPELRDGTGRVVLATIRHQRSDVVEVRLDDGETLRPTGTHRLYSADRDSWVSAVDLQVGEWLLTASGKARIASIDHVPGTHPVFNIEVEGDHEYFVSRAGVLSHNVDPCDAWARRLSTVLGDVDPGALHPSSRGAPKGGAYRDAAGRLRNADGTFALDSGPKPRTTGSTHGNVAGVS
jgi:hypothetical protein